MKRKFLSFILGTALLGAGGTAALAESLTRPLRCSTDALIASVSLDEAAVKNPATASLDEGRTLRGDEAGDREDVAADETQPDIFGAAGALSCLPPEVSGAGSLYHQEGPFAFCPPDRPDYSAAWTRPAPGDAFEDLSMTETDPEAPDDGLPEVPVVVNRSVQSYIKYFETRGRKHFERWLGRSQDYMSMLRGILREEGLPEDLSYIAFIESGLNPKARSNAKAVGMWQFIKGTAKIYGLRVDWWIDERMDPEKATYAAAKYFKNLYGEFGSWYLAAAGYNAGEGRVRRVVRKHKSEDFWVLASRKKSFARETKDYVPKYLAAMLIAKDPTSYGFDEQETGDGTGISYDKIKVSQATDLKVIAEAAETSVDVIKDLNPELLRWFTPPNYPDYEIKIPAGKAGVFAENMNNIPPAKRIAFLSHKVKRGDTISTIARRYGTSVNPILYINNMSGADKRRLKPGTYIMIPVRANNMKDGKGSVAEVVTNWGVKG